MIPFLSSIAKAYSSSYKDLSDFLFLFPNKRSGTFFLDYLKEDKKNFKSPHITTITDFIGSLAKRKVASSVELLFLLYHCYKDIIKDYNINEDSIYENIEFDEFKKWGETVIADFNIVDQYLIDPDELFKNVKDFREISSNFLTEEQKEVMEDYFGHTFYGVEEGFWNTFDETDESLSSIKTKFLHLWRILAPLYHKFNEELKRRNLSTPGGIYRIAYERLLEKGRDILRYSKIIVIGFNALSASEKAIFKELRKLNGKSGSDSFIDFFWDSTGPILSQNYNGASKFVSSNINRFPSPEWSEDFLSESFTDKLPLLKVMASPSNVAQTKILKNEIISLKERIGETFFKKSKIAVVLPDESLLIPLIYSLGKEIGDINLTMGYPFRMTSVFSFIQSLKRLFKNLTFESEERFFFYKDLKLFLSHPLSHVLFEREEIDNLKEWIDKYHRIRVSLSDILEMIPDGKDIFFMPKKDCEADEIFVYLDTVFKSLIEKMEANDENQDFKFEKENIKVFSKYISELKNLIKKYPMNLSGKNILGMLERLVSSEKVMFDGEPLVGLQVMGTLETRSLDFDYLFVLSMNEKIMPRKSHSKSFIPETLRKGYGLPPVNYSEEIFSYYFYRMISRAKEVTLLYDSRTGSTGKSSGVSRYILQLRHLFAKNRIIESNYKFNLSTKDKKDGSVVKTEEIKRELEKFSLEKGKNFSASSLNSYRKCEVRFFYESLLNINTDPLPSEHIDAITQGQILHAVMMELYLPETHWNRLLSSPVLIEKPFLENIISNEGYVWRLIVKYINKLFFHRNPEDLEKPVEGSAELIGKQIFNLVMSIVKHDMKLAPFKLHGVEIEETLRITLSSGRKINFRFAIDRLDEIIYNGESRLRIVDYKTGGKHREAESIEEIFKGDYNSDQIFQLFVYAWLLTKKNVKDSHNVMTEIYYVPDMVNGKRGLPKIGKPSTEVTGFAEFSDSFSSGLEKMINEIFEKECFEDCNNDSSCINCALRHICGK